MLHSKLSLLFLGTILIMMMVVGSESLKPISIHKLKKNPSYVKQPMVLPSGITVNTQQRALNYMSTQLMPFIQKQITSTIAIPDVNTRVNTPIGHLTATISQITLSNFAISIPQIVVGPTALQITIGNAQASMHCNWHYREDSWPHISDSGSADASVAIDITLTAQIVIVDETHFNVVLGNFNAKFTNFDLKLHGGASWLYNVFLNNFRDSIEQSAQNAINTQVAGAINTVLSKELSTLNLQIPILSMGVLFDSTVQSVAYNSSNSLVVGTAGRLFIKNQPAYAGPAPAMPFTLGADKMAEIFVSDYTLNTAGFAFNEAGLFNYLLTEHVFPPSFQWLFNTTNLQFFLPQLYAKYPGLELQIDFTTASPPTISISPAVGAEVNLIAQAIFQVVQPTGPVNAFALNLNAAMDLQASIVASNITGTLTYKNANVTLAYSNIGSLDVRLVSDIVNLVFEYGVVPIGNTLAKRGFPLPSLQGLTLVSPVISYQNRFIAIRSDFTYTPTTATTKKLKK